MSEKTSENLFQYSADLVRTDGTKLGSALLNVDWEPALEYARFESLRAAVSVAAKVGPIGSERRCQINPVWDSEAGRPKVSGFTVSVAASLEVSAAAGVQSDDLAPTVVDFPKSYFRAAAGKASVAYVESGQLAAGDVFHFVPSAHPATTTPDATPDRLVAGDLTERWPVSEASLAKFTAEARADAVEGDVPVVIPRGLLETAATRSREAGEVETGGVLAGHLRCDPGTREIFVEVTAELPARHTVAEMTRLEFTARTWTDARRLLGMRGRGEIMLGWWHSHVGRAVCKNCSAESRRACQFAHGFFSSHDRHFQRTAFPRAYQVGLVVNDPAAGDLSWSLFGWRLGEIVARGFLAASGSSNDESQAVLTTSGAKSKGGKGGPR